MKIGLFFGTFDPVHKGHIEIVRHVLSKKMVDKIWFVITPKSPFKSSAKISSKEHRMKMLNIAIKKYDNLLVSDIEFELKPPYYTSNTLCKIKVQTSIVRVLRAKTRLTVYRRLSVYARRVTTMNFRSLQGPPDRNILMTFDFEN